MKTNASRRWINNWGSVVGKIEKELIIHNQVITEVVYRCAIGVDRTSKLFTKMKSLAVK